MNATLGIDIGTYESKGVLVDADGRALASAARPHELVVPRAGWAEHRANEDWWADFVWLSQRLLADRCDEVRRGRSEGRHVSGNGGP